MRKFEDEILKSIYKDYEKEKKKVEKQVREEIKKEEKKAKSRGEYIKDSKVRSRNYTDHFVVEGTLVLSKKQVDNIEDILPTEEFILPVESFDFEKP